MKIENGQRGGKEALLLIKLIKELLIKVKEITMKR